MATAPQAPMETPQQGANPFADPNTMAVYDQMRQSVSPKEFGDQVLAGAEQVDPQEVAKFKSALDQIQMPPEALDLLNNMVDEILANPKQYAQIRAKYKEMGAPDEILPEQFDAHFFSALNMAVDQMIGAPSGEQAFAKGGIAELTPVSKAISNYGRNGDTMLAHITPAEARMLRRKGGSGTINPKTGLPEFFNLFKEIGNAFKAVGNVVKDFASSTVGRIITTVALGFFLGPAAASFMGVTSAAGIAAVSGFVGSAGATLAGGGNLSQALKAGAIGGLTAGATVGVTGGAGAFEAGSATTPGAAFQGQLDKFSNFMTPTASGIQAPSITPTGQATGMAPVPSLTTDSITTTGARDAAMVNNPLGAPPVDASFGNPQIPKVASFGSPVPMVNPDFSPVTGAGSGAPGTTSFGSNPAVQFDRSMMPDSFGAPSASATTAATGNTIAPPIQSAPPIQAGPYATPGIGDSLSTAGKGIMQMMPGTEGTFSQGLENFTKGAGDLFSPGPTSEQLTARAKDILGTDTTGKMTYADALKAANSETGVLRTYGPATAAGIAAIGAFGGFSPSKVPQSALKTTLLGGPGSAKDLLKTDPYRFYIQGLPGVQYYNGSVIKPPGMATGGEVQHFEDGGPATATDQQVADWWATNSDKGYSDNQIAAMMDQYGVTPEQFARSIGANESVAADIASRYQSAENAGTDPSILLGGAPAGTTTTTTSGGGNDVVTNVTGGGGGITDLVTDAGTTNVTGGGITDLGTGGGNTRSASDQAIWNYFANNTNLTDAQIVAAMNANKWNINDVARVTGTTANLDDFNRRIAAVNAANNTTTTTVSTGTGTGTTTRSAADQAIFNFFLTPGLTDAQIVAAMDANKWTIGDIARVTGTTSQLDDFNRRIAAVRNKTTGTGTGISVSTNTSIIRTTNTSTNTSTGTSTGVTTTPGGLTSIQAPWFINPQTFAQGTKGVTVPSSTLRNTTNLPTDALSRTIQGDLQAAGPTVTNQTMQEWMDSRGWKPEQVAYATGAGLPEVQGRYYGAKNAGILQGNAPSTTPITQPYNNTTGITQLMSPTGPLGEFSTRTVTPVTPVLPTAPTTSALPAVSFNRTDIQRMLPNIPNANPTTPLNVLAGNPSQYGVTGYTDAYSPFANQAKLMNMGGIAGLAQGGYPRRNGQIEGPGTETSDSIPAMLSDGEFVMTAKAVRAAGKGDRRAGAKRMYALMHQLEQNAARG